MGKIRIKYGVDLYCSKTVNEKTMGFVRAFNKLQLEDCCIGGIASTGSSGSIIATAILLQFPEMNLGHSHVGKLSGHNGKVSGLWPEDGRKVVFVDDFISTGKSLRRCMKHIPYIRYAIIAYNETYLNALKPFERKGVKFILI